MTQTIRLKIPEGPVLVEFADDGEVLSVRLEVVCWSCKGKGIWEQPSVLDQWETVAGVCSYCGGTGHENILSTLSPATLQHLCEARDNVKEEG